MINYSLLIYSKLSENKFSFFNILISWLLLLSKNFWNRYNAKPNFNDALILEIS